MEGVGWDSISPKPAICRTQRPELQRSARRLSTWHHLKPQRPDRSPELPYRQAAISYLQDEHGLFMEVRKNLAASRLGQNAIAPLLGRVFEPEGNSLGRIAILRRRAAGLAMRVRCWEQPGPRLEDERASRACLKGRRASWAFVREGWASPWHLRGVLG